MPEETITTEPVVEPTSETTEATAAAATTEATIPDTVQAAPVVSDTKPEVQASEETPTTNEAKPADPAPVAEPEDKPADRVVPEVSGYVLPEGVPDHVAQFAKDNDMTQDQLDGALQQFGLYSQQAEDGRQAMIRDLGQAHVEKWGQQKDYNLSIVRRALSQNDADGRFKALLDETGYGNHPVILDFFLSIGNSMKEGGFLKGANNTQSKAGLSAAQSMFGNTHPSNN